MTNTAENCLVCETSARYHDPLQTNFLYINCPRCGLFHFASPFIDGDRAYRLMKKAEAEIATSAWIREQNILRSYPTIGRSTIEQIIAVPRPNLIERSRRLLEECGRRTSYYSEDVFKPTPPLMALTWCKNEVELQSLADLLREEGFLKKGAAIEFRVTAQGIKEVGSERRSVGSEQVFVAMAFDPDFRPVYDKGLAPGILSTGHRPFRVDRHEHLNRIDDEIVAQIRRSKFLVADFTMQRRGVYFEAGFALGLGMPVIWTCRKDQITKLHFDVRQYNCVDWGSEEELAARLQKRIEAIVGRGPLS